MEKYLTTKLHSYLFGKYPEDRERDRILSERMAALQFVQPQHLDIPKNVMTEDSLLLATADLQKMNNHRVRILLDMQRSNYYSMVLLTHAEWPFLSIIYLSAELVIIIEQHALFSTPLVFNLQLLALTVQAQINS